MTEEARCAALRDRLRATFDADADRYDRARPRYPGAVFDALEDLTPGRRVVEIGCGSGIATSALVGRGFTVTGLEPGPSLAALARRTGAEVVETDAESWSGAGFDAVVAFTSFHWLDPDRRLDLVASWLRPGGLVALVDGRHVAGGLPDDGFFAASQACYERWDPATPPNLTLRSAADLPEATEFDRSPLFTDVRLHRFPASYRYTSDEYLDLLLTFSNHRALPEHARHGLLACLRRLLDEEFGGQVTRSVVFELRTARRVEM